MSRSQRDKGANGEREVAAILRAAGIACHRTPNSGGLMIPGDVTGLEGYHFEVKRQETLRLPLWTAQAEAEAPEGAVPIVVYRSSRQPWRASLPMTTLAALLAIAGRQRQLAGVLETLPEGIDPL